MIIQGLDLQKMLAYDVFCWSNSPIYLVHGIFFEMEKLFRLTKMGGTCFVL